MEEYFGMRQLTNSSVLCVGGITRKETESAQDSGLSIDGSGYYLFLAKEDEPNRPIEILAKLASHAAAAKLAKLLNAGGLAPVY